MWFDEEINLVIETDPFINVSGATSFSQIDNVTTHITEQPIIINLSENYAPVQSVNGKIGFVTITKEDLGISGEAPLPNTIVYTTGDQVISGAKEFVGYPLTFGNSSKIEVDEEFLRIRGANGYEIFSTEEYLLNDYDGKASVIFGFRQLNNTGYVSLLDWSGPNLQFFGGLPTYNGTGIRLQSLKNITYSELVNLKYNSGLIPGDYYKITDYITKWRNNSINDTGVLSGKYIEPLIIYAISNHEIDNRAYSTIYPHDEIYYNLIDNPSFIPNFKGSIYRRKDPDLNIDIGLDWRNVTSNCCKLNLNSIPVWSGNYNYQQQDVIKYNGNLYFSRIYNNSGNTPFIGNDNNWGFLINDSTYIPTDESNWKILFNKDNEFNWKYSIPFNTGSRQQFPMFSSNITGNAYLKLSGVSNVFIGACKNTVFNNSAYDNIKNLKIDTSYNNLFGPACANNEILHIEKSIIGLGFRYNKISQSINNIINNNFQNNFIYEDLIDNYIGDNFYKNVIYSSLTANIFGFNFQNNNLNAGPTILFNIAGNDFKFNSISANLFQYNEIGNNFILNNIKGSFYSNKIGDSFEENQIKSIFENNINTGTSCCFRNEFLKPFQGNNTNDNFQENIIDTSTVDIDFSNATHVYSEYNTRIFKNSNLDYRLSYYGNNDQLIITDATS